MEEKECTLFDCPRLDCLGYENGECNLCRYYKKI